MICAHYQYWRPTTTGRGVCQLIKTIDGVPVTADALAFVQTEARLSGWLVTDAQFGCVQFKFKVPK